MFRSLVSQPLLADLLSPDRVKIPLESTDKHGVIVELCALLAAVSGVSEDEEEIRKSILDREAVLSTGIGGGVAIPHGKSESVDDLLLVAGTTTEPIDFESLDARPVSLVLMLVGPESAASLHVKILSRISRVLRSAKLRNRLVAADSAREFLSALRDAESR
jgi:mannitol/fructose-specific phosphotransferase system IIA component (Ntr-type)